MVNKITKWFFLTPFLFTNESLHLLDISRQLNKNHTVVRLNLNHFVKEGFLKISYKGRLTLYQINQDFPLKIDYLSIVEKEFLINTSNKNLILKELIFDLHNLSSKPLIIFGSSVNNFSKAKDIDIISLEPIDFRKIEEKYNKSVHQINVKQLFDVKIALKNEIFKQHIIVNCVEDVIKWLHLTGV
jgi:hypothetical protein